jgi:hypothetical protein
MPAHDLTAERPLVTPLALPRPLGRHAAAIAVVALAALSLLLPSTPTYDPWSWIIWGREILHLDLSTVEGPSWKPLPVLLTTPFAAAGDLAPSLWMFVARAGALAGVVVVFRLAARLGGGVAGGAAAAGAYSLAPWTVRNAALGNSEGLLVALALGAVERHLAGRPRAAFALGVGAALLRPEVWPFLGLYGLWLLWRAPALRALVLAGFASLPVLWLLPELWGSGDLLRAMHRAQTPRPESVAFADDPARAVVDQFGLMLTSAVWVGLALLALGLVLLGRRGPSAGERRTALVLLAAALVWVAEVALMTSDGGFSGNARYLIAPAALLTVLAGTGLGWALRAVGVSGTGAPVVLLAVVAAAAFAWPSVRWLEPTLDAAAYQARLAGELDAVIARSGGADAVLACGELYAGPFQVPVIAWELGVHLDRLHLEPAAPATAFRARNRRHEPPTPPLDRLGGEDGVRTLGATTLWRIVRTCEPPVRSAAPG